MRQLAAAALLLVACNAGARHAPIASCTDDLAGVWATATGRWMILDNGTTLEAYPLFDDAVPGGAPRVIDLARDATRPSAIGGELKRRFTQRAQLCNARAPVHVTQCQGDTLQVVLGQLAPPLTFSPCTWAQQLPTHVENWRRE